MKKKNSVKSPSAAELAGDVFESLNLTAQQAKQAKEQLANARKKAQEEMSEEERIGLKLFQLKLIIEDYIAVKDFDPTQTFGSFLKRYVEILGVKRKDFALQISLDETLLSQLINEHRMPPEYVIIRLEIHSNNEIPAKYWFKLVEKQKEHQLATDTAMRRREHKYVHNWLSVRN